VGYHPQTRSREYREGWTVRKRWYKCRWCGKKFRHDGGRLDEMARHLPGMLEGRMEERLTLTVPEACRALGLSRNTGYTLIQRGEFPVCVIKAGKRILIPKIALERLLAGVSNG
jgi:excisionase family DNA binding protein